MPMSVERFPFYYRTQQQYEAVRRWTNTLRDNTPSRNRNVLLGSELRAELRSKTHDASKNFVKVPESIPGDKKYIGVLRIPTRLVQILTPILPDTIPNLLKSYGVELIDATEPAENRIKEPITVVFNVRTQRSLSKLASQLDKKIGTGNWRFRGTRNFRKKLSLIENGSRRNKRIALHPRSALITPDKEDPYVEKLRRTGVDVTVMVDASFGITQKEIEKMIFKAILSS